MIIIRTQIDFYSVKMLEPAVAYRLYAVLLTYLR
jgi:hypothetical protein